MPNIFLSSSITYRLNDHPNFHTLLEPSHTNQKLKSKSANTNTNSNGHSRKSSIAPRPPPQSPLSTANHDRFTKSLYLFKCRGLFSSFHIRDRVQVTIDGCRKFLPLSTRIHSSCTSIDFSCTTIIFKYYKYLFLNFIILNTIFVFVFKIIQFEIYIFFYLPDNLKYTYLLVRTVQFKKQFLYFKIQILFYNPDYII